MAHDVRGLELEEESGEDSRNDENEMVEQLTENDSQAGEKNNNIEQSERSEEEPEAETTMVDNSMKKSQRVSDEPRSSRGRMRKSQRTDNNKKVHCSLIKDQEEEYDDYPVLKFDHVFKNTIKSLPNLPLV